MSTEAHAPAARTQSDFFPSAGATWRSGLTSAAVALVLNLVILAVARLAGADMLMQRDETVAAMSIGVGPVATFTVVPMLLATALLLPLRRRGARAWRALATAGLVVGIVTVPLPFTVLAEGSTRGALAVMHVVAGVVWFVVVRRAADRRA